jgi:hypothetical protein
MNNNALEMKIRTVLPHVTLLGLRLRPCYNMCGKNAIHNYSSYTQ